MKLAEEFTVAPQSFLASHHLELDAFFKNHRHYNIGNSRGTSRRRGHANVAASGRESETLDIDKTAGVTTRKEETS